jgi:hypothetical protein
MVFSAQPGLSAGLLIQDFQDRSGRDSSRSRIARADGLFLRPKCPQGERSGAAQGRLPGL